MAKSDSESMTLVVEKPADKITSAVLDALAGGWTKAKARARPRRTKTYERGDGGWNLDSDKTL